MQCIIRIMIVQLASAILPVTHFCNWLQAIPELMLLQAYHACIPALNCTFSNGCQFMHSCEAQLLPVPALACKTPCMQCVTFIAVLLPLLHPHAG